MDREIFFVDDCFKIDVWMVGSLTELSVAIAMSGSEYCELPRLMLVVGARLGVRTMSWFGNRVLVTLPPSCRACA